MGGVPKSAIFIVEGVERLRETLRQLEEEWAPGSVPLTVAMSDLGRAFVEEVAALSLGELKQVLDRVEVNLRSGSESEKDALATGFLEAVASVLDRHPDRRWILEYAGEETCQYLKEWDNFCGL